MDFADTFALEGVLEVLQHKNQAVMNRASIPVPAAEKPRKENLKVSQFRHEVDEVIDEPNTFFVYPVFDSFKKDRELAGALASSIYWKIFFKNKLQPTAKGIICLLQNSFNQTLVYHVEGPDVTYLGESDPHDPQFDHLEHVADINAYFDETAGPETRAYAAMPLNKEYGKYTLRIYPAHGPEYSNRAWLYMTLVAFTFAFTSFVYIMFAHAVERRQKLVMNAAIQNSQRAAATARELNEFLSHEVRNPLSAAISACTFVDSAIAESTHMPNEEFKKSLHDDVKIISSSILFINDFLRSMLDLHRSAGNQMELKLSPTDLLKDVLEPVSNMFYQRDTGVDIIVECPENLVVMTDGLRLKQVVLNLGRNSAKFVDTGFIRFRAAVVDGNAELYICDSGPGMPMEKRAALFEKFQTSLDVLSQGTGIGLCLCKNLVELLKGDIWLDEKYDSGIAGCPGARFVIQLNTPPLQLVHDDSSGEVKEEDAFCLNGEFEELPEKLSVLFVDDDHVLRKLFARAVQKVAPSWKTDEAANGETAIQRVDSENFDLIFIDQYMASTEKQLLGTETTRVLRSKGVKSIICGLSANDMEQAFLRAGADAFVMKPLPCGKNELKRELIRILCAAHRRPGLA
jgi:signal transduction histidine kinase/CheY-like chemotaxis protein